MHRAYRVLVAAGLLATWCSVGQVRKTRNVVLPNPRLIHCRSGECSQLWKEESSRGGSVLPAQILLDTVNGEIVGLTSVYEKSVSTEEIRAAIEAVYGKSVLQSDTGGVWRFEREQLVIQLAHEDNGESQLIYLKIAKFGTVSRLTPAAHIFDYSAAYPTPTDFTGFWKSRCSDAWGVQIERQTANLYAVSFCGPAGCFEPGTWMPNTQIVGDPKYRYINPTALEIQSQYGWQTLTKCTPDTNPVLDDSMMPAESPSRKEQRGPAPAPKKP
jgi:hypothetical protein